jgi:hypothetical protein
MGFIKTLIMFDDTYIGIVIGLILGGLLGFGIFYKTRCTDYIESKTLITPTITIHIQPDGTRDTTFIYTK